MGFIRSLFSSSRVNAVVLQAFNITPRMRRLVLGGPEIAAWLGNNEDARVPASCVKVTPEGRSTRVYTIRRIDEAEATLHIDFALHGNGEDSGTVSDWARFAKPGDRVDIHGPRKVGYHLFPDSKWLWLAADVTALPAAQSIMESLPQGIDVHGLFAVHDSEEQQAIQSAANLHINWVYAQSSPKDCGPDKLPDARTPGQVLIAGESDWVKSWRAFWLNERQIESRRVDAKGYWKRGVRGRH
ncbi:MAG: siderophore-interacting protein [Zoogloeaceae bacterium]|jgi:NADPH-dependent ferric siderophore reductase|nr:siderophore-interacting protein [Zoogloeaceae bacterium]